MKPLHLVLIIGGTMLVTLILFGGGVYFGKRLDQICLGTPLEEFPTGEPK